MEEEGWIYNIYVVLNKNKSIIMNSLGLPVRLPAEGRADAR
jgi:hypothetical protein